MKVGDLVKLFCTCGNAHDEDPLIGVIIDDGDGEILEIMVRGNHYFVQREEIELVVEKA